MSKKNFIQVFEYQKLKYDEHQDFKKHHFDSMVLFNEKNQNKYFTIVHKGVLFTSYVGVIQIGSLTIEILPKVDKDNSNSEETKKRWQSVLLNMLQVCKHIQVDTISETNLNKKHNAILEVYFEMYLNELESLVKKGLIKKYRKIQSNQNALKGKLVFSQNIQKNLIHKERFYCEHQLYDRHHLIHQILFRGLLILKDFVNNNLKDKLNRILFEFQDYKHIIITKNNFDKLVNDRKTTPYLRAIDIAKMIILNYSPNLNSGNDNMLTLLFDMNKLWEEYIYRILQKYKPNGYQVSFQNSDKFWEHKTIRPDIVITNEENKNFVIDTKWKIINANNPSDDDLKQMFTYNLHWNAEKTLLLYPKIDQEDSKFGTFYFNNNKCKLGFINILDSNNLINQEIVATTIFEKFELINQNPQG